MVERSRPRLWKRANPPSGAVLVHTLWLCTYWERRIDERDGQHQGSAVKNRSNDAPCLTRSSVIRGKWASVPASRSSAMMTTMFGGGSREAPVGSAASNDRSRTHTRQRRTSTAQASPEDHALTPPPRPAVMELPSGGVDEARPEPRLLAAPRRR